jgi:DNA-binding response OmpR family regulator
VTGKYPSLAGQRILLVEDDLMISVMLEEWLRELDSATVATVSTVEGALKAIRAHQEAGEGTIDGVLLDLDLRGQSATPVIDALRRESLPFIIISGSGSGAVASLVATAPRLTKPFTMDGLAAQMAEIFRKTDDGCR